MEEKANISRVNELAKDPGGSQKRGSSGLTVDTKSAPTRSSQELLEASSSTKSNSSTLSAEDGFGDGSISSKATTLFIKPKIVMEIMSGQVSKWILAITWITGILCFTLDVSLTVNQIVATQNYDFHVSYCDNNSNDGINVYHNTSTYACLNSDGSSLYAIYTNVKNPLTASLYLNFINETSYHSEIPFTIQLWGCENSGGCGSGFRFNQRRTSPSTLRCYSLSIMSILTHSLLAAVSIHILLTFHLLLLPLLSHCT
jgi:hypothetical protein